MTKSISILSTIKAKIALLVVVMLLLSAAIIVMGAHSLQQIKHATSEIIEQEIPISEAVATLQVLQLEQTVAYRSALQHAFAVTQGHSNQDTVEQQFARYVALNESMQSVSQKLNDTIEALVTRTSNPDTTLNQRLNKFQQRLISLSSSRSELGVTLDESFQFIQKGDLAKAIQSADSIETQQKKISGLLNDLLNQEKQAIQKSGKWIEQETRGVMIRVSMVTGILAMLALLLAGIISKRINQRLKLAIHVANGIAKGDLTQKIPEDGKDEIQAVLGSIHAMQENLKTLITAINHSSMELSNASTQLTSTSENSNQSVLAQKQEIDQIAIAIQEMTATVQEVAKHANQTAEATQDANHQSTQGNHLVTKTIQSIEALHHEISHANEVISQLNGEAGGITSVLDVIKGIAEQTNLLALNAAIEAARAGEQGRGFAVVADEVRTLAQRTQESTSDIENMIEKLQSKASMAVDAMTNSQDKTKFSVEHAKETGAALKSIVQSIQNIADMNTQIASAAEEQSLVAKEINANIHNVSNSVDMVAQASNEIMSAAGELSHTSTQLHDDVSQFKIH